MASRPKPDDYEKLMGRLEGNTFQDEVCARLQTIFVDFQRIPAMEWKKPMKAAKPSKKKTAKKSG